MKKSFVTILTVLTMSTALLAGGCGSSVEPVDLDITVDGKAVKLGDTVQTLIDEGLVLCDSTGVEYDIEQTTIPARTVDTTVIYLGVEDEDGNVLPSDLTISVYNDSSDDIDAADSLVYQIEAHYYSSTDDGEAKPEFLVNGASVLKADPSDVATLLTDAGVTFDDEEVESFENATTYGTLTEKMGDTMYSVGSLQEDPTDSSSKLIVNSFSYYLSLDIDYTE